MENIRTLSVESSQKRARFTLTIDKEHSDKHHAETCLNKAHQ